MRLFYLFVHINGGRASDLGCKLAYKLLGKIDNNSGGMMEEYPVIGCNNAAGNNETDTGLGVRK